MPEIIHRLTGPQYDFVHAADRFPLFLGGFGAGKSEALVCRMLRLLGDNPGCNVGYFAPTYDLIRLIAWDRFESKLTEWGVPYRLNKSSNDLEIGGLGRVIFRTLDNPARIVGFEIADAGIDWTVNYVIKQGQWTIAKYTVSGTSKYVLWRDKEWIAGPFKTADEAKAKCAELQK